MKLIQNSLLTAIILSPVAAMASPSTNDPHLYTNAIIAHNIGTIHHSITDTAIAGFLSKMPQIAHTPTPATNTDPRKIYGRPAEYGTMRTYGEYGDDGTVFAQGRNGGDIITSSLNVWANWTHINDQEKFKNLDSIDSKYNIVIAGAGINAPLQIGHTTWGAFAGYAGGDMKNDITDLDARGGYIGAFGAYEWQELTITATATAGAQYNDAHSNYGTDEYSTPWLGATVGASYIVPLDNSFWIRPAMRIGYTWVRAENYVSHSGVTLNADNTNLIEFTPEIQAIKHIGNGWYGIATVQYIIRHANGGDIRANDIHLDSLDARNYTAYGLGIQKEYNDITFSLNISRHDGGRNGWNGGARIGYAF